MSAFRQRIGWVGPSFLQAAWLFAVLFCLSFAGIGPTVASAQDDAPAAQESKPAPAEESLDDRWRDALERFYSADQGEDFAQMEKLFAEVRTSGLFNYSGPQPLLSLLYASICYVQEPSDETYKARLARFDRWSKAYPDSCIPLIGAAGTYRHWAWFARGEGFALEVKEDAWRPFRLRLIEAGDLLDRAEKKAKVDPDLYVERILVATGAGAERKQVDEWLAKGRRVDEKCLPLYRAMAIYLLPRWHGQPGDIARFAEKMRTEMPGAIGTTAYAVIAFNHGFYEPYAMLHGEYDMDVLHKTAKTVADQWPECKEMNEFAAHVAWLKQDHELAKQASAALGGSQTSCWWRIGGFKYAFDKLCKADEPPAAADKVLLDYASVESIRFSASGEQLVALCRAEPSLRVWDIETARPQVVPLPIQYATSLDRHPTKDQFVMTTQADQVHSALVVDLEKPDETQLLYQAGLGAFHSVQYAPDGQSVMATHDKEISFWDLASGKVKDRIAYRVMTYVALAPDGKQLLSKGGDVYSEETKTWAAPKSPNLKPYFFHWAMGMTDEQTVVGQAYDTKEKRMVLLAWKRDADDVQIVGELPRQIHEMRFSAGRGLLAVIGNDNNPNGKQKLTVFDLEKGRELASWSPLQGCRDIDFSPDESLLAVGDGDGAIRIFSLPQK